MFTAEPYPVGVSPDGLTLPYLIVLAFELNSSPAAKTDVVPAVPEFVYLTYNVAASPPETAASCITFAVTPLVAPVIVVPTNSSK